MTALDLLIALALAATVALLLRQLARLEVAARRADPSDQPDVIDLMIARAGRRKRGDE